ncbi:hypothetical protein [Kitasatospora sp. SolWspMP-SS2h]|uniref:hypothetical protein n=1 Tax=Kitasatospora sp. SolWspMP-SS2h TaxID=1305729 RepID=UPI0011B93672|nr:hypothetical protein [Kitasatospora sp. SolWspMP-SS2h]
MFSAKRSSRGRRGKQWPVPCSSPGGTGGIAAGHVEDTGFLGGALAEERRRALVEETHDRRPDTVEDVAATVHFLASPGARHLTGPTLRVNGGARTAR